MRFDSIIAGNPKLNFAKDVEKSFTPHEAATMINGFLEGWIWAKFYEIPVWVATRKDNPLTIVDKLAYCLPSLSKRRRKLLWFLAGHVTTLLHENQLKMRWWCDGDDTFSVSHAKMTLLLGNLILKIRQSLREIFPARFRFLFFQASKLPSLSTSISVNNRNNYWCYPSKISLLNAKRFISYMIDSIWHLLGFDWHPLGVTREGVMRNSECLLSCHNVPGRSRESWPSLSEAVLLAKIQQKLLFVLHIRILKFIWVKSSKRSCKSIEAKSLFHATRQQRRSWIFIIMNKKGRMFLIIPCSGWQSTAQKMTEENRFTQEKFPYR